MKDIRAFEFFGGVPQVVVPDNLKAGVTHPCRYEPDLNPTYLDMANHYGTVVIPARVRRPGDKAKVESAAVSGSGTAAMSSPAPWATPPAVRGSAPATTGSPGSWGTWRWPGPTART